MKIREPNPTGMDAPTSERVDLEAVFYRALRRVRGSAAAVLKGPALAGAMALTGPNLLGCTADMAFPAVSQGEDYAWMQEEGQRNTEMVSYLGGYWSECRNHNPRFGCSTYDIFVKLRVRPVASADLYWKRVGIEYRNPTTGSEKTAVGYYFASYDNGDEEWHVPVNVATWEDLFTFTAWYQDGALGTYYDDNNGEYHVINNDDSNQVVRTEPWLDSAILDESGVHGALSVQVADLDFDKQVALVATVDGWETVLELGMGAPGDRNAFYWVADLSGGRERWAIDLDLPGDYQAFEYAVRYRHGVVNGATPYDFWANNLGHNYSLQRIPTVD